MDNEWLGSKIIVKDEEIKKIVQNLHASTLQKIQNATSYIEIHNAYTAYTVMLLFSATGHRPVEDPFCYKADYDLDLGMMLIDDKAVSERHRYRLVALPKIAVEQIQEYEKHLKWLVSHLMKETISPELKNAVYQILNTDFPKKSHSLPMFFFLKRQKKVFKTYSISESNLKDYFRTLWPLPYNFSRHNIATKLRMYRATNKESSLTVESIEAHLGHMSGINHPFGTSSATSPIMYQNQISKPLNTLLSEQNWSIIKAKRYHKNLNNMKYEEWKHSSEFLGPIARHLKREKKKKNDQDIVTAALNEYPIEDVIKKPLLINEIRSSIINKSSNDEERIKIRLILLWRKLLSIKKDKPHFQLPQRLHLINIEPSPFSSNTLITYREAEKLRDKFIAYLQTEGKLNALKPDRKTSYYKRVSEILISASLFDGIANTHKLKRLSKSNLILTKEGDVIYLDIMDETDNSRNEQLILRWLPQPLSIALTTGINSEQITNVPNKIINISKLEDELKDLLVILGLNVENKNTAIKKLAKYAKAYWLMHLPPFLREISNSNLSVQPLPEAALVRLIRNERLIQQPTTKPEYEDDSLVTHYAMNVDYKNHRLENSKNFHVLLKKEIIYTKTLPGKNNKSPSNTRKKHLAGTLRALFNKNHKYSSIAVAIGSWSIKLCDHGTDLYGTIAFSTVSKYTNMIAETLFEIAYKRSFFHLSPDEYDSMYEIALEANTHSDQSQFLNNLKDFHSFLVHAGLAPPLDWITFNKFVSDNRITSSVDASFISNAEYERALNILYQMRFDETQNQKTMMQYCALLICGYRFGLRISEAMQLQYRNIQHNDDWTFVVLNIVNNFIDDKKTSAGIRYSPLIGQLTEWEVKIVSVVFDSPSSVMKDELAIIFSDDDNSRVPFNTFKASQAINKILKLVTGDPFSHFHLLRHSYACQIYPQLFDIEKSEFSHYIQLLTGGNKIQAVELRELLTGFENHSSLGLKALSIAIGHSQVKTTFSNYIHTSDHHIHYIAGRQKHWLNFSIDRIDFITSYAHGKNWETLKKQRQRRNINTKDILSALSSSNANISLQKSQIETMSPPKIEDDIETMKMYIGQSNIDSEISLEDIDNVLLLSCQKENISADYIAERLNMTQQAITQIIHVFKKQKNKTNYLGYHTKNMDGLVLDKKHIKETPPETTSIHNQLKLIHQTIKALDSRSRFYLYKGLEAWSEGYYPNKRYLPLILNSPDNVIEYLAAMKIIGVRSVHLMLTLPKNDVSWCKLRQRTIKNRDYTAVTIESSSSKKTYLFNSGKISLRTPFPPNKSRYTSKERISISLEKDALHPIHVQKRLHRLCFILSVYLNL